MTSTYKIMMAVVGLIAGLVLAVPTLSFALPTLPPPDAVNSVTYGDFYSYSLPVLQYVENGDDNLQSGDEFYVASSPGELNNEGYIVLFTGTNNAGANDNPAGMDDAYRTPEGTDRDPITEIDLNRWETSTTADPGGAAEGAWDQAETWDTSIAAMTSYLGDQSMVVFFNNNDIGAGGNRYNQSLYAVMQVKIWDTSGVAPDMYFDLVSFPGRDGFGVFGGDPAAYTSTTIFSDPPTAPGVDTVPAVPLINADGSLGGSGVTDYVLSGGDVYLVDGVPTILFPGDPAPSGTVVIGPLVHNLGANAAAYAVWSPEIDAFLAGWTPMSAYDAMSFDMRLFALSDGYEQAFIAPVTVIPEPASLGLVGLGLAAIAAYRKRNRKA